MLEIKGIAVSNGIAIANAYCLVEPDLTFDKLTITDIEAEKLRFKEIVSKTKIELEAIREAAEKNLGTIKQKFSLRIY